VEEQILLSVVIITKDEEENVHKCIESVLRETASVTSYEIILVDSASEDKTVELASNYPIRILQLRPEWFLSPAAGRYVGTKNAQGNYILFIDGDMALKTGWLKAAVSHLKKDEKIAGVCGRVDDICFDRGRVIKKIKNSNKVDNTESIASAFGGAGIYKRSILNEVGGFNPYLRMKEEQELAMRIRQRGYYLLNIPIDMVDHYTYNMESLLEARRFLKFLLQPGVGQLFRIAYNNNSFLLCAKETSYAFHFFIFLFVTLAFIMMVIFLGGGFLYLWFAIVFFFFLLLAVKKKSVGSALVSCVAKVLYGINFVCDFPKKPKSPEQYPLNPIIIK
jgi:glycosyltransferase involved in cell wall biosynthesis